MLQWFMHRSEDMARQPGARSGLTDVHTFIDSLYGSDLHAKRIASLAGATLGVMQAASLAVAMIGQALAQARGLVSKHAVKQVDRLLSNAGIDVWDSFARWVPHQIGGRQDILMAMDWTECVSACNSTPLRRQDASRCLKIAPQGHGPIVLDCGRHSNTCATATC